ncbi:hypothetical protein AB0J83_33885 [Actinoplanes sp. NPDC049596]|uniref:hypothetical protein n=1 Tax=unclassified Actinoplanes TaxID=2626549 RepID=UPI0034442420
MTGLNQDIPGPRPAPAPDRSAVGRATARVGGPNDETVTFHSVREYSGKSRQRTQARSRTREYVMLAVLTLMALADAYGFWITLIKLFQQDTDFLLVFVVAIALGTVAAAHELGRLARSRREGFQGSLIWMAILAIGWLAAGATLMWIRVRNPITDSGEASGPLAAPATGGADDSSLWAAALLLVLYVLTGVLAMTHAYQYRDPRSAELRDAEKEKERLVRLVAERQYEKHLAEEGLAAQVEIQHMHRASRDRRVGEKEYLGQALHEQAAQDIAKNMGSPSATSELIPPKSDDNLRSDDE